MPRRSQLAKAHRTFRAAITEYIERMGAVRIEGYYEYEMHTPAGRLLLSIGDGSLFTKFENLLLGRAFTASVDYPCNPFTGQWQFHHPDEPDALAPSVVRVQLGYYFEELLAWKPDTSKVRDIPSVCRILPPKT